MKTTFAIIGTIVMFIAVIFGLSYFSFSMDRFFAPKQEALRRQVFEQSQAYNAGMLRDLENIQMEYQIATPAGKAALRAISIHRFEAYPEDQLPADLHNFYNQLKAAQ